MKKQKLIICFLGNIESIHMVKWARYFLEQGHKVHFISYNTPSENYDIKNLKLHLIRKQFSIQAWPFNTLLNLPFTLSRVKRLIERIKPDIINAHYVTSYGSLAALLNFHPLVMTAWGSDILITPKKFLLSKWVVKYALQKADLITCDAEHMKKAMIELGADAFKIKIINFGIDIKKFTPGLLKKGLKKKIGIPRGKVVISLRSLEPIYSVDTLIKAAPKVIKEFPEVKFIIAGKGSQGRELKRLTKDLGVEEKIIFIGQIPNEELPNYLRLADVYVSTSLSDGGIASSTAEAMACEIPVIVTDTGENKKWIKNGESGFVIPIQETEILAEKIVYLLTNKNERKKIGQNTRRIIKERNNYYKEMSKMEELYKDLIINNKK